MNSPYNYPEYAAIQHHIRHARIERVVPLAEGIAGFIVACWNEVKGPPRRATVIINDRFPFAGIKGKLARP